MNIQASMQIGPPRGDDEQSWLTNLWQSEWGGDIMVSRGHVYQLSDLMSLVAKTNGELVGAATYRVDDTGSCEIMSINAVQQGVGVGTKLLCAVEGEARWYGCQRIWLITSNDNLDALRFYQQRGYRMTSVHSGAIDEARTIKQAIPLVGNNGIEIHDEIELEKTFDPAPGIRTLDTGRLVLRPYSMADLGFFASLWGDSDVVRYIGEGVTRSWDEAKERLERVTAGYETGYGLLAMWHRENRQLVGHAGLVRQDVNGAHEIELGYWLARHSWGQGLATEAALALRDHALKFLGLKRIISLIQPANTASIAVAERIGMKLERQSTFKGQTVSIYSMDHQQYTQNQACED